MKISREVRTAILVISGLLLFIYMYNFLKGDDLLNSSRTFYVIYDHSGGVTASSPITINGLKVGRVQEVAFLDDGSGKIKVTMAIESDFQFSKNSVAELYDEGLLGGKAIAILPANDNAENATNDSFLQGTSKSGLTGLIEEAVTPIQDKVNSLVTSADSVLQDINEILDDKTKSNIKNAIAKLNVTIGSFQETSNSVKNLIKENQEKLNNTLSNFENISSNFSKITDSIASANLTKTIKNLESTVKDIDVILINMKSGEGTLGKLLKDEELYNNLNGASLQLEQLLEDIKLHPKRYFRILSKKEIPYEEPVEN